MQPVFIFFLLFSQGQMPRIKFVNIIKVEKSNERLLPFLVNVYRPGLNPYQIKAKQGKSMEWFLYNCKFELT